MKEEIKKSRTLNRQHRADDQRPDSRVLQQHRRMERFVKGSLAIVLDELPTDKYQFGHVTEKRLKDAYNQGWEVVRRSEFASLALPADLEKYMVRNDDDLVRDNELILVKMEKDIWKATQEFWEQRNVTVHDPFAQGKDFRSVGDGLHGPQVPEVDANSEYRYGLLNTK
jgi:hypothetical protein